MGRGVLVVCFIAFFGLCVRPGMARRGPRPNQLKPQQGALSNPEIEEIRAFASNAYRNEDQMSSFSHFVGRRMKNRPLQSNQQPFAVMMRRPMRPRPPRNEIIQTSASQNSNSYFAYRPPLSNHILPLPFFSAFKPKRPNLFRRPSQRPFSYSHPPTLFSGEPSAAQIQAEHQKKLEAWMAQQHLTGLQQAHASVGSSQPTGNPQVNKTTSSDGTEVRNKQPVEGVIVKSNEFASHTQQVNAQPSSVAPPVDYLNSYEPSVNFMKPPLPLPIRSVPFQLISQTVPLYQEPSFQDFSFHTAPSPNFPIRMNGYYIPPKYSTIPASYLSTEKTPAVESSSPATPTASSASTPSSVANSISITSELPPTSSVVVVSGDTGSQTPRLNSPSQVSSPIIFESARIPEEVAISGGISYNQRPLTLTPEEQRNVFTAAADSSLVVAPLVFSENSVSPIRNYETIDITNHGLATSTFAPTTPATNNEETTSPEPKLVTRTLPGGKRVRFRKVKKNPSAQRNA